MLFGFWCYGVSLVLAAENPRVDVQPHVGTPADTFQLSVTVSGDGLEVSRPQFDSTRQFQIQAVGTATRVLSVNGVPTSEMTFNFIVRPAAGLSPGVYALPRGRMSIDGQTASFDGPKITLLADTSGGGSSSGSAQDPSATGDIERGGPVDFTQLVDNFEPYVGEQILYRSEIALTDAVANPNLGYVTLNGFFRESFGKNQEQIREIGNTQVHSVLEALFPLQSGDLVIPERVLTANIRVSDPYRRRRSWDMFDDFLGGMDGLAGGRMVPKKYVAKSVTVHVKELPPAPEPDLGYVPVGTLVVNTTVDQTTVKQGESISMKIDVVGDANLKPFELGKPIGGDSKDFKIYVDKPELESTPGKNRIVFRKRFSVAFVPQHAGTLSLPKYRIVSFNPKEQRYVTADTGDRTVTVTADAQAEKLVVRGGTAPAPADSGKDQKIDVRSIGEGLFPLHLGPQTYASHRPLSGALVFWIVVLLPCFVMPLHLLALKRRERLSDPAALAQAGAHRTALENLGALEREMPPDTEERCLSALRTYFGNRFRLNGESLTSADVGDVLSARVKDDALRARAETVFRKLQRAVYGGSPDATEKSALIAETRSLVNEVEKHAG